MLVKFFAYYREPRFAGCKAYDAEPQRSVREALVACCDRWPGFEGELLNERRNALGRDAVVMVNGVNVMHTGGLDTPLSPDDTLAIFPRCAGG